MEHNARQSIHEIGLAMQLVLSPGRAEMVTVGNTTRRTTESPLEAIQEVGDNVGRSQEQVGHSTDSTMQSESGNMTRRGRAGPQLVFRAEEDAWSTFSNPECTHERYCGHMPPRSRSVFPPGGAELDERVLQLPKRREGADARPPFPHSHIPHLDSRRGPAGIVMDGESGDRLPSKLGPFLLKSLSNSSIAEGRTATGSQFTPTQTSAAAENFPHTYSRRSIPDQAPLTAEQEYYASRTADWVVNLSPEAIAIPGHAPPLTSLTTLENSDTENSDRMGNPHRGRYQEDDSAIRGNFIPLSTSFRERSPSPRREQGSSGVYLQFSLTDSQMERLTAVLSSEDGNEPPLPRGRARTADQDANTATKAGKENAAPSMRSRSPAKTYQSATAPSRARSRSPVKFNVTKTPENQRTLQDFHVNATNTSSKKKQETPLKRNTPVARGTPPRTSARGAKRRPAPIDTELARAHARLDALRVGKRPTVVVHNPPERASSPVRQSNKYPVADDSSSFYSQESIRDPYPSYISPLHIQKPNEPKHVSILQAYTETKNSARASDKRSEASGQQGVSDEGSNGAELAYTPLADFIPQVPLTVRKASKTLIGEGGWLENTSKPEPTASPNRGGGFLGNLVKKAKEMIEANHDSRSQRKSRESDKTRSSSRQLAISLSPREQSLLYCELEFTLATALNDYITAQFEAGRLGADKLQKTAEDWQRNGRPRVVGFRYDLETQLGLVRAHVNDFKFYSHVAAATAILGILDTARANARALRIRTFCQPDTVVAKHLLDAQGLFNILGCPEDQQIKLAEMIAFFKAAAERRRVCALREQGLQQQQQQQGVGVGGPPAAATSQMQNNRSPEQQGGGGGGGGGGGEDWWGTAAGAVNMAGQQQLRNKNSLAAGKMDPAGYGLQGE